MNSPASPQAKRHIGQILISQGILTEDQLRIALLEQLKSRQPVGKLLVQLGFVSEATLRDALSEKLGLQSVDLSQAERIVAVGRVIKGPEHLPVAQKLSASIGAELAASLALRAVLVGAEREVRR